MPCKTIIKLNDYLRNLINRTEFLQYLDLLLCPKKSFKNKNPSMRIFFSFQCILQDEGSIFFFFDKNAIFKVKGFATTIKNEFIHSIMS